MRHSVKGANQGRGLTATRGTRQRRAKAAREVMVTGSPAWTDNRRTQDRIQKGRHGRRQVSTPASGVAACPGSSVSLQEGCSRSGQVCFLCAEVHGGQEVLAILLIKRHPRPCFTSLHWSIANERRCDGFRGAAKALSRTCAWIHSPQVPSRPGCHTALSGEPCAVRRSLLAIHCKYSGTRQTSAQPFH